MARDHLTRLAEMTTLWELTCQVPGVSVPHGLVRYKVRALTPELAADMVLALHPSWTVLKTREESTSESLV